MNTKSVICCIDKRFDSLVSQYYDSIGQTRDYYMITAAGSSLPLSYNKISRNSDFNCYTYENCIINRTLREGELTNFNISKSLSNIQQLDIIDHQDCGAFRVFLPCADLKSGIVTPEEKEKEREVHKISLDYAEEKIKKTNPSFQKPIQKLLIDLNGTVAKLLDNNLWDITYIGSGTNPNGLWWEYSHHH